MGSKWRSTGAHCFCQYWNYFNYSHPGTATRFDISTKFLILQLFHLSFLPLLVSAILTQSECFLHLGWHCRAQFVLTNATHPVALGLSQYILEVDAWVGWSTAGINAAFPVTSIANITGKSQLSFCEFNAGTNCTSLDGNADHGVLLGSPGKVESISGKFVGQGRTVYLAPVYSGIYLYNSQNLRFGPFDQLLENALYWATKSGLPHIHRLIL